MNRNVAFVILGSLLGALFSFIFLLIYLAQEFSLPVSDSLRMRSALIITALIFLFTLIIWFRKEIYARLKETYGEEDDDDEETE